MKLTEIVILKTTLDAHGIDMSVFSDEKEIGNASVSGHKLFLSSAKNNKKIKKVSLYDANNTEVAFIAGIFFKFHKTGETFFKIDRAWVSLEKRKEGLMSGLIYAINRKWNISFMSDRDLTQQGLGLWKKMKTLKNVKIYDGITGKRIPWTDKTEKEIFVPDHQHRKIKDDIEHPLNVKANRFYLVTEEEHIPLKKDIFGIPFVPIDILAPYNSHLDK